MFLIKWHPLNFLINFYTYNIELNINNTLLLFRLVVIPSSAVFLFTRPVSHWSAVLINRNHTVVYLFSKKVVKNDPIQRSLLYWLRAQRGREVKQLLNCYRSIV
jgi:hypothetical protein